MQHILNVLEPAATYDLLTVDDVKTMLSLSFGDTSRDAQIGMIVSNVSEEIPQLVNRVFAKELVQETFYATGEYAQRRLYFSRWPVALDDIQQFTRDGVDILANAGSEWVLEEKTGTLYRPAGDTWNGNIDAIYSGGYDLPDGIPLALRRAALMLAQEAYYMTLRGDTSIRSISHKESRVQYFSIQQMMPKVGSEGAGTAGAMMSISALLSHFRRDWV
jgi:hypothetical protein